MSSRSGLTVLFAGGGTGGHLYPAIAIARALRERSAAIEFVGTADRLEATIVPKAGFVLHTVAARPLTRTMSVDFVRVIAANAAGVVASARLLRSLQPDIVIATGGYVCFPVVLAARILRLLGALPAPIALLEPNVQPGLTNRLLAPMVDEVWGALAADEPRFAGKYVASGVPVRPELRSLPRRDDAQRRFELDADRKTLLVLGGSQGARTLNDAAIGAFTGAGWPKDWQLLLVSGDRDYARVRAALPPTVAVIGYLDDVGQGYAVADLVLARAGASTLAELAAAGKPAILVPYPYAAADHQTANARSFARSGAAIVISDARLAAEPAALVRSLRSAERLHAMDVAARQVRAGDPLATILARVDCLTARKSPP